MSARAEAVTRPPDASAAVTHPAPSNAVPRSRFPWFLAVVVGLTLGWWAATGLEYRPGSNVGYYLGVAGGSAMLTLLLYPLRKRIGFMRGWLPMKHWFRAHMLLGVIGPALIVLHSRFSFGSINGTVAFACMSLVFFSGLFGRFAYGKIHHGLYGRHKTLAELKQRVGLSAAGLSAGHDFPDDMRDRIQAFERRTLEVAGGPGAAWGLLTVGLRASILRRRARRDLRRVLYAKAAARSWDRAKLAKRLRYVDRLVRAYLAAVQEVAEFSLYERIFSYWHLLHVPLLILLILTGVIHVLAVHMY